MVRTKLLWTIKLLIWSNEPTPKYSKYNCIADKLARSAFLDKEITNIKVFWKYFLPIINKKIKENWNEWVQTKPQFVVQLNRPHINLNPSSLLYSKMKGNRLSMTTLIRIRSQHILTKAHLNKIQIVEYNWRFKSCLFLV